MISNSLEETKNIAKKFATNLKGGDIVLLSGDLGAGKTAFTKGLAEYFEIKKEITSPTFAILNIYNLQYSISNLRSLVHIDTYRLKSAQELIEIGVEDYLGEQNTICIIEWPEKIMDLLKNKKTTTVEIKHITETQREITIK